MPRASSCPIDEVDFVTIPDDATRILKLQAGEVDGAEFIPTPASPS
jgi:ABC-type transport system substrate-binding protein